MNPAEVIASTFRDVPPESHGPMWERLWAQSVTPWDRAGPSMPLHDLLAERPDVLGLAAPTVKGTKRKTALVPGCGKGHDVLLLSSWGYDVVGLDLAETALNEAKQNADAVKDNDAYKLQDGVEERGKVTWVLGDFFANDFLKETGNDKFDLIFDFTVSFIPSYSFLNATC